MSRALERLASGPVIVADGGTGALLSSRVPRLRCPEEANLRSPETVVGVHLAFIRAGAELIETNTFGANRRKLSTYLLDDRLQEIVEAGVKLAREAREVAGSPVLVAGSMGPLGDLEGTSGAEDGLEVFCEQARHLEARGVDLFMVETFFDLEELETAIEAVRSVSQLPIVAQLTFDQGAQTLAGVSARSAVERLQTLGVAAAGANCGLGPQAALAALAEMADLVEDGLALTAQPNVGLPSRSGGRLVYPNATPDYFAEFAAQARSLGARIIGGCCGTMPAQIGAICQALEEGREPRFPMEILERDAAAPVVARLGKTELQRMFEAKEWVVSVELDPPKGTNMENMLRVARLLKESGVVHVTDLNDNPMARARLSALVAAASIERLVGIETIPHVTPRDASIMGLQSQLLGAHADGVRNVLAVTGDPPHVGDYPGSRGVYEVDAIGLTAVLTRLNEGEDYVGKAIDAPTSFHIGVAVNPSSEDLPREVERFLQKVANGAHFAMTQALFDIGYLDRFLDALGGESPIPILVGIWPVQSHGLAYRLHNEVPGIVIPQPIQERLAVAGSDAGRVGLELARELLEAARSRAAGIYVIPPFKEPEAALELFD